MTRTLIDCTGSNAAWVRANLSIPEMIAVYDTGSPDIRWTPAQKALFPHSVHVTIDQGGTGSPVTSDVVRDVEPHAWLARLAEDPSHWTAAQRTIYCDRSDLETVVADGWRGRVWLAWPGWSGEALPHADKVTFVAVQNKFTQHYDSSIVLDDTWQTGVIVVPASGAVSVTLHGRFGNMSFPRNPNASHYVVQYLTTMRATPVLVGRAAQPASGPAVHMSDIHVPEFHGGNIRVYAIVNARPVLTGTFALA